MLVLTPRTQSFSQSSFNKLWNIVSLWYALLLIKNTCHNNIRCMQFITDTTIYVKICVCPFSLSWIIRSSFEHPLYEVWNQYSKEVSIFFFISLGSWSRSALIFFFWTMVKMSNFTYLYVYPRWYAGLFFREREKRRRDKEKRRQGWYTRGTRCTLPCSRDTDFIIVKKEVHWYFRVCFMNISK